MTVPYVENPAELPDYEPQKNNEPEVIVLGKRKFVLDRKLLRFNEENINSVLAEYAALFDSYGEGHVMAQAEQDTIKHRYESLRQQKFAEFKESEKCTEKLAEAKAINDPEVQEMHERLVKATYRAKRLGIWLRSLDDCHSSVKEFCYNLRKEMDKIYGNKIRELDHKFQNL